MEVTGFFVNVVKSINLEQKNSKINSYLFCLGNIAKDFTDDNMKKLDYMDMCMIFSSL